MSNKAKLLYTWTINEGTSSARSYRLVALAKSTPGYEDSYHIEMLVKDLCGGDRWDEQHCWDRDNQALSLMTGLAFELNLMIGKLVSLAKTPYEHKENQTKALDDITKNWRR